jgi:hypothetical protein
MTTGSTIRTRRSVLAGGLGALTAVTTAAIAKPVDVLASVDGDVVLGAMNETDTATIVRSSVVEPAALQGEATAEGGIGVRGTGSVGVAGYSETGVGVTAVTDAAYDGVKELPALWASSNHTSAITAVTEAEFRDDYDMPALRAFSNRTTGIWSEGGRRGIHGYSDTGIGVLAHTSIGTALDAVVDIPSDGLALRTVGRVQHIHISGVAYIRAGKTTVTITPRVAISARSFVLLTPRTNLASRGLWYVPDATKNQFTIKISSPRTSNTPIAWLLLDR